MPKTEARESILRAFFRRVFSPVLFEEIVSWRRNLAEKVAFFAVFIIPPILIGSFPSLWAQGHYDVIVFDVAIFVWAVLTVVVGRGLFAPSGIAALSVIFACSTFFHLTLGPTGARPIWLALFVALAASLYGLRGVVVATLANVIMLSFLFVVVPHDLPAWKPFFALPLASRMMYLLNASMLIFILGAAVASLLIGLERQLAKTLESEARYRLLADNASDVIWTLDPELRLTYVSPSVYSLGGYRSDEIVGNTQPGQLISSHAEEVEAIYEEKLRLAARGDQEAFAPFTYEAARVGKDGKILWTRNHVRLVQGEDGGLVSIVGVTHDVTARREAEEAQASLREQFHESQKMEAIGRLAGGVAHDFNNVLCAIKGNAELLLEDIDADSSLRESVEMIDEASDRAANLTRQLLAFSRKQVIEPKNVDLGEILRGIRRMLVRVIGEDIDLRTEISSDVGRVRVDPGQIEQVLLNLVINARDAMPDGGSLVISVAEESLGDDILSRHPPAEAGDYVVLAVRDTGTGMSEEVRQKIFEPFFTTKERGKGTGLGLATVLGVVEQNGGFIEVTTEEGKGTTFSMYFPCVEDDEA